MTVDTVYILFKKTDFDIVLSSSVVQFFGGVGFKFFLLPNYGGLQFF